MRPTSTTRMIAAPLIGPFLILATLALAASDPHCNGPRSGFNQSTTGAASCGGVAADRSRRSAATRGELPVLKSSKNSNERFYVDVSQSIIHANRAELNSMSKSEYTRNMLIGLAQSAVYNGIYQHRYETFSEMKLAQGPAVDDQKCLEQLEVMANRTRRAAAEGFASRDTNIHYILDLWGREAPRHLKAHLFFEGAYEDCLRSELRLDSTSRQAMRYCVMKFKYADWGPIDRHDIVGMSMGVCIPKTCNSASTGRKFELISEIAARHLALAERDQMRMSGLYCLPDEDSPARSIWRAPKTLLVLACLSAWIGMLLYASHKYEKLSTRAAGRPETLGELERIQLALFRKLSIWNNLRSLLSVNEAASKRQGSGAEVQATTNARREAEADATLDLRCIEGIKVIAMCYVILGHVLMCMSTLMRNGLELADEGVFSVAFLIANLLPAFAVNSFFAITGLLTSYLVFKQHQRQRIITSPAKWIGFILHRYLRIMPMYALVVLYCKSLAKYTGSGPLWDYGTSALSQRRACEHEDWSWTLTFSSNFLSPLEQCIPGGWYLSNDFQFALVTPLFLVLLYLRPKLGQLLLYASIATGYVAGYVGLYNSDLDDFRPIANFSPSGFKTYVSHLSFNYTHPQYRIPAFLVGLLAGYKMHVLEEARAKFIATNKLEADERQRAATPPSWSPGFRKYGAYLAAYLILVISTAPFFGLLFPFCKQVARVMASWANPALHVHFATGITHFVMLAATGDANKRLTRFLSAPIWKPLARMSLSCVLINVEVINFIIQRQTRQIDITNSSLMLLNVTCIVACYAVAAVVSCLFEAPIRAMLNAMLALAVKGISAKSKGADQQAERLRLISRHEKSA